MSMEEQIVLLDVIIIFLTSRSFNHAQCITLKLYLSTIREYLSSQAQ